MIRNDEGELFLASSSQDKRIRLWKIQATTLTSASAATESNKDTHSQNVHFPHSSILLFPL
jgi:hypothetical protein